MNDGSSNHKPKVYNLRTRPTSSISTKNNASNVQNETISSPPQEKTSSNSSKSNTTASNQKKILSKQVPENTLDPLISLKVSDPEKKNISHPIKMNPEVNGKVSLTSTSSIFEKKNTTPQSSLNILSNEVNPEVSESTLSIAKGRRKSRRSINSAEVTELTKENPKFPSNAFEKNHEPSFVSSHGFSKSKKNTTAPDWDFWEQLLHDYDALSSKAPGQITENIRKGVPDMLRGDIWLKLARVSTLSLKDKFHQLLEHTSPYEKIIQRDLLRTFPKHPFFRKGGKGVKSLFHLMKVYSLYDIEVGYCQGLAFVAGPILLNIHNEVESFSLFVSLLNNYNLRQLYLPSLDGLHLFIFQLDTLIKNRMPEIHAHFVKEGVKSSMYATEWFMTLFAYRLPLEIEYRVLDLIFSEGVSVIFSIALALLAQAKEKILTLVFDQILDFLKLSIFKNKANNLSTLIDNAFLVEVSSFELDEIALEFEMQVPETQTFDEIKVLRQENRKLIQRIQALELEGKELHRENHELTHALVQSKEDLSQLHETHFNVLKQLSVLKKSKSTPKSTSKNSDLAALNELNSILNLQLHELQDELTATKNSLSDVLLNCERLKLELEETKPRDDAAS